nr:transport and Golgi organization protein 2-like isoform X2 [Leptinotarsa decemlineata]XP_023024111.1 transport and Golgi organization protein 2-like isoform X2 [Leptinotarsa decemlineata]XP_023024112.1 transport and Golgi organization protein 2-like isoform X2 [Leptinotarsa decemlineata]XP_023024114.1 transport and Golgi organization protein 2-like isoform X2 [Leptinotarsa decemlineata]XP_023024115.1 transport and Golgi organization protein 2-like isoform X2 [Leptinotarsa decemlineata]
MCILFLHVDPNPPEGHYRLIVATNRDEYYKRPSRNAFTDESNIIGGVDLEKGREGGRWLGFTSKEIGESKKHCLSALLNITGELTDNPSGRGTIVNNYLETSQDFPQYVKQLGKKKFNGFNLIAVELSETDVKTYHYSNTPKIESIYSGKHTVGFGNSPTYIPLQKVIAGRNQFIEILDKNLSKDCLEKELIDLLKNTDKHLPDLELQKRQPVLFESLSSIFVRTDPPVYGTRTHTIVLIDYNWNLEFIEHTMKDPIDNFKPIWINTRIESKL